MSSAEQESRLLELPDKQIRCSACEASVERELLLIDATATVCIECLTAEDRRRLEQDLTAAGAAQRAMLPPVEVEYDGWQIAYAWQPAGPVSGDHVDLILPAETNGPAHLMFGDVAGKGVAAALVQARLHALFRALADPGIDLGAILARTNTFVAEATVAQTYATLLGLRLHTDGRIEMVNAGHPRPLVADRRGVRAIEGSDLPLGMFADASFTRREIDLVPGSTLLLFTDGVSEAVREEEEFGLGRTAAAFRRAREASLPDLLLSVRGEVEEWCDGNHADDLTLLAIRRSVLNV